jgi:hypothetical protein
MNDTPRTNDIIEQVKGFRTSSALYSLEQFSRLLERELTAVTEQRDRLEEAIRLTLMENLDLCDGDICTLKRLKDAIGFEDYTETTP